MQSVCRKIPRLALKYNTLKKLSKDIGVTQAQLNKAYSTVGDSLQKFASFDGDLTAFECAKTENNGTQNSRQILRKARNEVV